MTEIRSGIRRVFRLALGRRSAIEAELGDELETHLELSAQRFQELGMSPDDARIQARRRFHSLDETRREFARTAKRREGQMRITRFIDATSQDAVFVARQLVRSPGLSITVVTTLALGIGANALMFGILDRLLFRPPPGISAPERIGRFGIEHGGKHPYRQTSFSYATFRDVRDAGLGIPGIAAYSFPNSYSLGRGPDAREIQGMLVSPSYFDVLGVRPAAGRFFDAAEGAEPAGQPVVVISHSLWERQFGGDRSVLGRRLTIGQRPFTVIGVAPARFTGTGLSNIEAWIPLTAADGLRSFETPDWMTTRKTQWLGILFRLDARLPDDSLRLGALHHRLTTVFQQGEITGTNYDSTAAARVTTILRRVTARNSSDVKVARLLLAVSVFVLLIACANVANLLLARSVRRQQEIAVRIALGVSRGRLTRLLILETVFLALIGGGASIVVANWLGAIVGTRFLGASAGSTAQMLDGRVLAFAGAATFVVVLLTSLVPVSQALRATIADAFRAGSRAGLTRKQRRTTTSLLLTQVALCTVLLIGTGLFVRSLRKLNALDLGIDTQRVLVAEMDLKSVGYSSDLAGRTYDQLIERVRQVPGVESASLAMASPFSGSYSVNLAVPGLPKLPEGADGGPYIYPVDEHYFGTLGIRILAGRGIQRTDRHAAGLVVVVNQSMARRYWPGQNALGKCMKVGGDTVPCSTVVGVVENSRRQDLIEGESFQYFVPLEAGPSTWRGVRVLFARAANPERMVAPIRHAMQSQGSDLPFAQVQPMRALLADEYRPWELGSLMFSLFGGLALVLAVVGLYGSLAYDIAQRRRELSVRVALGAQARDILGLVLRRGVAVALIGVSIGVIASLASARLIRELLYEVSARDPIVFATVAATILVAGLAASLIPARRATAVDIREALTSE